MNDPFSSRVKLRDVIIHSTPLMILLVLILFVAYQSSGSLNAGENLGYLREIIFWVAVPVVIILQICWSGIVSRKQHNFTAMTGVLFALHIIFLNLQIILIGTFSEYYRDIVYWSAYYGVYILYFYLSLAFLIISIIVALKYSNAAKNYIYLNIAIFVNFIVRTMIYNNNYFEGVFYKSFAPVILSIILVAIAIYFIVSVIIPNTTNDRLASTSSS